ncbi:MAG: hypothetical protein JNJ58_13470 [Chitinophagaceae bacterium]|nr:hypothetical protein [Chitinophagaceae bacterium]
MKKILLLFPILLLQFSARAEQWDAIQNRVNEFLKTFDHGFYGEVDIHHDTLYNYYKGGGYSFIPLNQYTEARVVIDKRKVGIFCLNNTQCVINASGSHFDMMPFSTQSDFDAAKFAKELNDLIKSYLSSKEQIKHKSRKKEEKVISLADYPAGMKIKIIQEDKVFSLYEALVDEEEGRKKEDVGIVVEDLKPLGDGWYSGSIKQSDGRIRKFEKAKVAKW